MFSDFNIYGLELAAKMLSDEAVTVAAEFRSVGGDGVTGRAVYGLIVNDVPQSSDPLVAAAAASSSAATVTAATNRQLTLLPVLVVDRLCRPTHLCHVLQPGQCRI